MKMLNDYIKPILAISTLIFSFTYFFICTFTPAHADPQIIIAIVAALNQTYNYYFGNATGAAKKDATIADMAKQSK